MFCERLKFSCRWLREFIDDPFRGHVALIEFLQYLHLNQPPFGDLDVGKRKGRPDVLARDFVSDVLVIYATKVTGRRVTTGV